MAGVEVVDLVFEVIKLADTTIRGCQRIVEAIRDAPKELRALILTISTFKALLQHVEPFMGSSDVAREKDHIKEQVQRAKEVIKDLDALVVKPDEFLAKEKNPMARLRGACMMNWNQPKVTKHLEGLRRCQESINKSLTADTSELVRNIASDVREMKDKLSDDERRRILHDLVTVDPTSNHREACALHEPHTSGWITRSEEWKTWIEGDLSVWWIDGSPGAGKTILASYLIQETRDHFRQTEKHSAWPIYCTYYYCYHARTHAFENEHFLRWIVGDLARQAGFIPPPVT